MVIFLLTCIANDDVHRRIGGAIGVEIQNGLLVHWRCALVDVVVACSMIGAFG